MCKMREEALRDRMEARDQLHAAMALERAQLVTKVLLRGLVAVRAAKTMDFIVQFHRRRNSAVSTIQRSARRYLRVSDIAIMKNIRSDTMVRKRKDVAVDLIKQLLTSTSFHNKFMRGISRIRQAAKILQFSAKNWLIVRNARHEALIRLFRKLEPGAIREARRLFSIKQKNALMPNGPETPEWLTKGATELAHLRSKCLKISNHGKALVSEAKRAEHHRKLLQEQQQQQNRASVSSHKTGPQKVEDEEVRLNFLHADRLPDHNVAQECAHYLLHERMKIFEKVKVFL